MKEGEELVESCVTPYTDVASRRVEFAVFCLFESTFDTIRRMFPRRVASRRSRTESKLHDEFDKLVFDVIWRPHDYFI